MNCKSGTMYTIEPGTAMSLKKFCELTGAVMTCAYKTNIKNTTGIDMPICRSESWLLKFDFNNHDKNKYSKSELVNIPEMYINDNYETCVVIVPFSSISYGISNCSNRVYTMIMPTGTYTNLQFLQFFAFALNWYHIRSQLPFYTDNQNIIFFINMDSTVENPPLINNDTLLLDHYFNVNPTTMDLTGNKIRDSRYDCLDPYQFTSIVNNFLFCGNKTIVKNHKTCLEGTCKILSSHLKQNKNPYTYGQQFNTGFGDNEFIVINNDYQTTYHLD